MHEANIDRKREGGTRSQSEADINGLPERTMTVHTSPSVRDERVARTASSQPSPGEKAPQRGGCVRHWADGEEHRSPAGHQVLSPAADSRKCSGIWTFVNKLL